MVLATRWVVGQEEVRFDVVLVARAECYTQITAEHRHFASASMVATRLRARPLGQLARVSCKVSWAVHHNKTSLETKVKLKELCEKHKVKFKEDLRRSRPNGSV